MVMRITMAAYSASSTASARRTFHLSSTRTPGRTGRSGFRLDWRCTCLPRTDQALATAQVERVTHYEKGFPLQYEEKDDDRWEPDPWTWDDQGIVFNVNGKGLVVASSCSHSGAVNVLHNAQRITGVNKVHAFIGGMHLSGGIFEKIIPQTIRDIAAIHPDIIIPGHCTGWRAMHLVSHEMPEAYVQGS